MEEKIVPWRAQDGVLSVALSGRIDSSNAPQVEKEIFELIGQNPSAKVIVDVEKLQYISSAGLRVILKLKKEKEECLEIINVSSDVYEIFEVTGFTTFLKLTKAMRKMSVEGCELIGEGGNCKVYRIDRDTILKVYTERTPLADIEKERNYAQSAFLHGIPTAISYDIVKVGECRGIVFELINADTVAQYLRKDPEHFSKYIADYAALLKKMHSTEIEANALPNVKEMYLEWVDRMGDWITAQEKDQLRRLIASIPERRTVIHGDYHVRNVMIQNEGMILIDMADVGYGHPIFDLAGMFLTHVFLGKQNPKVQKHILGIDAEEGIRVWNQTISLYFGTQDAKRLTELNQEIALYAMVKTTLASAITTAVTEEQMTRCVGVARERLFPYIERMIGHLSF